MQPNVSAPTSSGRRHGISERGTHRIVLIGLAVYLLSCIGIGSAVLVTLWPGTVSSTGSVSGIPVANFWLWTVSVAPETQMLGLVLAAGALGGAASGLYAEFEHVVDRDFKMRWLLWFVLHPVIGAFFGFVLYLALRAGLFSIGTPVGEINVFGFTGLAAVVGFFQGEARAKLQQIAESALAKARHLGGAPFGTILRSGEKAPASGVYAFLGHAVDSACTQYHHDFVELTEGELLPAPRCNQGGFWEYKSSGRG